MGDPFATPTGPISVMSMFGRGLIALAIGAVTMAILVPLSYAVSDGLTESKRRPRREFMDEEDSPLTMAVGLPPCGPTVDPVKFIETWNPEHRQVAVREDAASDVTSDDAA